MNNYLDIEENKLELKYFLFLMLFALFFSVACRYIYISTLDEYPMFKWNDVLMLNTNDGYYYAKGAKDILLANVKEGNYVYPAVNTPLSQLTAFVARIIPISFEEIILWMPVFFGSLIVVPIMLIARVLKQDMIGFIAALISSIGWSYYSRTMAGYFDTDMLIVVLPTFIIYGIIYTLKNKTFYGQLFTVVLIPISIYWHAGTSHIIYSILMATIFYILLYERKNLYYYQFIILLLLSLTSLAIWMKIPLILVLALVFKIQKKKINNKFMYVIYFLVIMLYLIFGGMQWVQMLFHSVYITNLMAADIINIPLHYLNSITTIKETQQISFELVIERISGNLIFFILSILGYFLLIYKYRVMIVSIPMVVLGLFSMKLGLRFTIFAVPFMSFGLVYFIFLSSKFFDTFIYIDKTLNIVKKSFIGLFILLILKMNIDNIQNYIVPTVLNHNEIQALSDLNTIASKDDHTISWWDYGYPIAYYSDTKVLVDGRAHSSGLNFPISLMFTTQNQKMLVNLAKISVKESAYASKTGYGKGIFYLMKKLKASTLKELFSVLERENFSSLKTNNIYIYIPEKMLTIFSGIYNLTNVDPISGKKKKKPFFYVSNKNHEYNNKIYLGNNIVLNRSGGFLEFPNYKTQINRFIVSSTDVSGKIQNNISIINKNSDISMIYRPKEHQFIVMDDKLIDSTFIQLYLLEEYNKDYFELVISNKNAKIYKLKI